MLFSEIDRADYQEVLNLNSQAVPNVNLIDEDQLHWFVQHAAFPRAVKVDNKLAGFMIGLHQNSAYTSPNYRWFNERYEHFAYIDRIVIADWAQRRGIAEKLYALFAASQVSAPVLVCEVNIRPANEGSMKFHRGLGFRQIATREYDDGSKEIAYMEKQL